MRVLLSVVLALAAGAALLACVDDERDGCNLRNAHCSPPSDAAVPVDARETCDPLAPPGQTGCDAGLRCTWVETDDGGVLACAPMGTVPVGGACTVGPPGLATGFDDCVEGAGCVRGVCHELCGGPTPACEPGSRCNFYDRFYEPDPDAAPVAGVCELVCDPVAQTGCGFQQGCYLLVSSTATRAVCAGAGSVAVGERILGQVFANSCVPGAMPRRRNTTDSTMECGALCRPTDVAQGLNEASEGGVAPATCAARGAPAPTDPTAGESCRYWHTREQLDGLSPFSNVAGWCAPHVALGLPRCTAQAAPAVATGCVARPAM